MNHLSDIFHRISETYETPIKISSQCRANVFYRIEDLTVGDLNSISDFLYERVLETTEPIIPDYVVHLPSCMTELPEILATRLGAEVINSTPFQEESGSLEFQTLKSKIRGSNVLIVNDIITTAKSSLELHSQLTMLGASVLTWAALIDRTFGPGPVPVVAAHTGEPVELL